MNAQTMAVKAAYFAGKAALCYCIQQFT